MVLQRLVNVGFTGVLVVVEMTFRGMFLQRLVDVGCTDGGNPLSWDGFATTCRRWLYLVVEIPFRGMVL